MGNPAGRPFDPAMAARPLHINPQDTSGSYCGAVFGSIHASLNSVFCDGSVHSISFSVDANTWQRLCCINDGLPIHPNAW